MNLGNTLADMKAKALVHFLGDTPKEQKPERQCETLSDINDDTLVDAKTDTQRKH